MSTAAKLGKLLSKPLTNQMAVTSGIMVLRPLIMLTDKAVPIETREYAATREFFTELFGLGSLLVIGSTIKSICSFVAYDRNSKDTKLMKPILSALSSFKFGKAFTEIRKSNKILTTLSKQDWGKLSPKMRHVNGVFNLSSYAGIILALAVITPILNNTVINKDVLNGIKKGIHTILGIKTQKTQWPTAPYNADLGAPKPAFSSPPSIHTLSASPLFQPAAAQRRPLFSPTTTARTPYHQPPLYSA